MNLLFRKQNDKNSRLLEISDNLLSVSKKTLTKFDINTAIKHSGDLGNYQIGLLIYVSFIWMIVPSIPIMIPFYRTIPEMICDDHKCLPEEICNPNIKKLNVYPNFRNWSTDFKINCVGDVYYGILSSLYFIGTLVGLLFVSRITNKYGRRRVIIFFINFYLVISIFIIIVSSFYLLFFYLFIIGIIYSGSTMSAFVLVFESTGHSKKNLVTTIVSMSFGVGAIFNIFLFYYFQNWKSLIIIEGFISLILIFYNQTIKESPEFLYSNKNFRDLKIVLEFISKKNNCEKQLEIYLASTDFYSLLNLYSTCTRNDIIDTNMIIKKNENTNLLFLTLLKNKNYRLKTLVMSFNWFVMSLTFYGINFNLGKFGINNYLSGLIIFTSEIIAQFISMFISQKIGDKYALIFFYFMTYLSLILITFINNYIENYASMILLFYSGLLFSAKFGISSITNINYIYSAKIFPVSIRMTALSFFKIISRLGAILSTIVIEIYANSTIIFAVLCIVSSLFLMILNDEIDF